MQGTLTFVRIYSGTLETGTFVSNPNKGKKERIGRIQLMHANNREDIKVQDLLSLWQSHASANHMLLPITCFCPPHATATHMLLLNTCFHSHVATAMPV